MALNLITDSNDPDYVADSGGTETLINDGETFSSNTEVSLTSAPTIVTANSSARISFIVSVADAIERDLDVEITARLYVSGTDDSNKVETRKQVATDGDTVNGSLSHTFSGDELTRGGEERTVAPVFVEIGTDYYGADGFNKGKSDDSTSNTLGTKVTVGPQPDRTVDFGDTVSDGDVTGISNAYNGTTPFRIEGLQYEDDSTVPSIFELFTVNEETGEYFVPEISFEYENPTISIDGAGRFAKHEIIGGTTVRQKIGEDPLNVSISGVCEGDTANKIDSLRDAKFGRIYSERLPEQGDSLQVQFGSTSTEPITDGGGADLKSGELLYSYTINCIEVIR